MNVDLERIGKSNMGITLSIYTHALPVRRRTPQQFWIGCWVKAYWLTDQYAAATYIDTPGGAILLDEQHGKEEGRER